MIYLQIACLLYAIGYIQYNLIANTPDQDDKHKAPAFVILRYVLPSVACFVLFHMLVVLVN